MPREEVSFARGTKSTIPDTKVPGRLLIAVDTGEAYVDDTTESRVQLKDSTKVSKSGDTMNGVLNMSSNKITALATPTADTDAANLGSVKSQVNTAIQNAQYAGTSPISVDNIEHTISHDDIGSAGSVGPTANSTASHGGTITVPYITVDAQGHVSAKADRTITLPAGPVNMKGATTSEAGAAGYAPAPSAGEANRYLRSDGTWAVPPDTNTTYNAFEGATDSAAGSAGLVPAPAAGYDTSFLRGDGTWAVPTGGTYTAGRGLSLSGTEIGHATSITADNRGPTGDATVSPGSGFTVPQIYYDAYGHVTSSAVNRTLTIDSNILDTGDILTSLSGITSNEKVLGAKVVADAINNLNIEVSTLNSKMSSQTILWQGAGSFMNELQTLNLSENVSDQKNGILLIWSRYNEEPKNYGWVVNVIPKILVGLFPGSGHDVIVGAAGSQVIASKYLYIFDNQITGNSNNNVGATRNWVLRYVVGY